ncbi:hypothetical protein ATO12_00285 [Aquimarina atlantica]|uniref:DUF4412 domain-containing protein n=2 Tax=Aquimarina atlantica TaxID=1317122 RepID=A0A023C026_9FLAO|nr:hypothetical protein ATO12_00285 [Aquimarina atlantica]
MEITPTMENLTQEMLKKEIGDTIIGYVRERKYAMTNNAKGDLGAMKMIFLLDENIMYIEYEKSDTIRMSRIDKIPGELLKMEENNDDVKNVLGDKCSSIRLEYKDSRYGLETRSTHYFNPKYRLNKEAYQNHKYGYWNLFVDKSGSISVRNEDNLYPIYKSVMEAFSIEEKEVSDELFKISEGKVIKSMD